MSTLRLSGGPPVPTRARPKEGRRDRRRIVGPSFRRSGASYDGAPEGGCARNDGASYDGCPVRRWLRMRVHRMSVGS